MTTKTIDSSDAPPLQSVRQAHRAFNALARRLGYPYFHVSLRYECRAPDPVTVVLSNAPAAWLAQRAAPHPVPDPLSVRMQREMTPFAWGDIRHDLAKTAPFFEEAARHGLRDGLCVPVHCPGTEIAKVMLVGAAPPSSARSREHQYAQTWMFTTHMMQRLRDLLTRTEIIVDGPRLDTRQRRIVGMLTDGYTVDQMAEQLGLHRRSAEDAIRVVCTRFDVHSRTEMLERAIATGQIDRVRPMRTILFAEGFVQLKYGDSEDP